MRTSEAIDKIAESLAKAQGVMTNPEKNKTVKVRTRSGDSYGFAYADLAAVIDAIKKPLSDNGIAFAQALSQDENGKFRLVTTFLHSSGQFISSTTPLLIGGDGNQDFGSSLTFMKRYALAALAGIAPDSDDDANTADGNEAKIEDVPAKKSPIKPIEAPVWKPPTNVPVSKNAASLMDWVGWGTTFSQAIRGAKNTA